MILSEKESYMHSKYYGRKDLVDDEAFWKEAADVYYEHNVGLPIPYSPSQSRWFLEQFKCGGCTDCCRYLQVQVSTNDIERITQNTEHKDLTNILKYNDKGAFIPCANGCPFLVDKRCSIYQYRPDNCYLFPMQGGILAQLPGGTKVDSLKMRLKCKPTIDVCRLIMKRACVNGRILLPDLQTLQLKENDETN